MSSIEDLGTILAQLFVNEPDPSDSYVDNAHEDEDQKTSACDEVVSDCSDYELDFYDEYSKNPANAFERPTFYRVVDDQSPPRALDGTLLARLSSPPAVISLHRMQNYRLRHASLSNKKPTPWISLTSDLLRAFNIAGNRFCQGRTDIRILLIDAWTLGEGNHVDVNTINQHCGLAPDRKYETEILVWHQVPSRAIVAEWTWTALEDSGIFKILPSLKNISTSQSVEDLRRKLKSEHTNFSVQAMIRALHFLQMDPSSLRMKQVFEFFLGSVIGERVPRRLLEVDKILLSNYRSELDEFDSLAHRTATSLGKQTLIELYRKDLGSHAAQRKQRIPLWTFRTPREERKLQAEGRTRYFCPTFRHWWARREESDLSDLEAHMMVDHDTYGIRGWMYNAK